MRSTLLATVGIVVLLVAAVRADDTSNKPDEEGFIRNWLVLAPLPFGRETYCFTSIRMAHSSGRRSPSSTIFSMMPKIVPAM